MTNFFADFRLSHSRPGLRLLSALLLSSALASPALAGTAGSGNGAATSTDTAGTAAADVTEAPAIVVTARHRNERLEDVPLAITAVSGGELATKHLDRVADYATKVPNFSALQQNTRVSGLFIRGLGGNASNDGAEGVVGLIVDNVVYDYVGFSWLDFVDLDSIEVVRGPQGTLLGKNTTIGALIVNTQKPSWDRSLEAEATYGNEGRWQLRTNATGPLTDTLAYRLTFATSQGGGWIPNAYNGVKLLNNDRWSLRGQLLWKPVSGVSDRLIVEHYDTEEYNNYYPVVGDIPNNLNPNTGAVISARNDWTSKLENNFGYTPNEKGPYNANLNSQERLVSRTDGVSNELNWDIGRTTLTSVSAWRRLYFRPYNDSDYTPYAIDRNGYDVNVNQYSQELRLASRKGGFLEWQIGSYYLHEDLESKLRSIYYGDASQFFYGATVPSAVLNGLEVDHDGRLHVDSLAGFGQATLNFTSRLSLTGGLRYTNEWKRASVVGSSFGGAALTNSTYIADRAAIAGKPYTVAGSINQGSWSWLVNPSWKATDHIRLYASASYGEKSGAANLAATAAQASVLIIKPEKSTDFEAGIKSSWLNGRLTANLNFYNDTITNYQDSQVNQTETLLGTYLANVGKVRMRGVELETTLSPLSGVNLNASGAYNDARYLSYDNAPAPVEYEQYLAGTEGVAATATTLSLTGYQLRNAPRWTLQGGIDIDEPISSRLHVTGYWDVSYRSRTNLVNPRSIYYWQPGYALVNAGIGLKTADERTRLLFWAKNLFNTFYATMYNAAPASGATPINEVFGDPRSYGVTLSHKF